RRDDPGRSLVVGAPQCRREADGQFDGEQAFEHSTAERHNSPQGGIMTRTASFDPAHPELLLDLEVPTGQPPTTGWPVIVWIHGGGWRLQDRTARPDFSRHFCESGFAMVSIDYRLAPEHP